MDKFLLSAVGFFAATVTCCLFALFSPQWVVSDFAGFAQFGLFYSCHSTPGPGGTSRCTVASPHHSWLVATGLISAAVAFFVGGVTLFLVALVKCRSTHRLAAPAARRSLVSWGKWTAFIGTLLLCLAGVTFPAGFASDELGGRGYLLPEVYSAGSSYYVFILAILSSVVGQVVANRLFITRFR